MASGPAQPSCDENKDLAGPKSGKQIMADRMIVKLNTKLERVKARGVPSNRWVFLIQNGEGGCGHEPWLGTIVYSYAKAKVQLEIVLLSNDAYYTVASVSQLPDTFRVFVYDILDCGPDNTRHYIRKVLRHRIKSKGYMHDQREFDIYYAEAAKEHSDLVRNAAAQSPPGGALL